VNAKTFLFDVAAVFVAIILAQYVYDRYFAPGLVTHP
jgi:hypothetical protein